LLKLASVGEWFGDLFPDLFRLGAGGIAMLPAEEERCLVDEDSDKPAFEGAFAAESWGVAGGCDSAVFYRLLGVLNAVEDAAGDEMEQFAAVRELQVEGRVFVLLGDFVFFSFFSLFVLAGLTAGFGAAGGDGSVDVPDAFRGRGRKFWGGGCHKHVSVLQSV
jgi:hypothetical protein